MDRCTSRTIFSLIFFVTLATLPNVSANAAQSYNPFVNVNLQRFHPVLTFSFGSATSKLGQNQTFPAIDDNIHAYTDQTHRSHANIFGFFIGVETVIISQLNIQLGLSYYQLANMQQKGILLQGPDEVSSDLFPYQYKITANQVFLESKLLWVLASIVHPYLTLGIGSSTNKAYDYLVSYPIFLTFTPLFKDKSTTSFAYLFGLGVDIDVYKSLRLGIGYRYTNFGKPELGQGTIDFTPISQTLHQPQMNTQEFLIQLIYVMA